jgi:periplasmic protein TonB
MLQSAPGRKIGSNPAEAASDPSRRRKLLVAMVILFATLIVVLARDGQLWFYSGEEAPRPEDVNWVGPSSSSANAAQPAPAAPATVVKKHTAMTAAPEKPTSGPAVVATNRAPLPPLNIQVASGNNYQTVHLSSNAGTQTNSAAAGSGQLTNVAQRSPQSAVPGIEQTVVAEYPLLAQQMKVQGSVLMQALVRADGVIDDLRVISGPAILSAAARQAVLQYHFKPYLQDGQPVATSARITVNFAIRVLGPVTAQHHPAVVSGTNGF